MFPIKIHKMNDETEVFMIITGDGYGAELEGGNEVKKKRGRPPGKGASKSTEEKSPEKMKVKESPSKFVESHGLRQSGRIAKIREKEEEERRKIEETHLARLKEEMLSKDKVKQISPAPALLTSEESEEEVQAKPKGRRRRRNGQSKLKAPAIIKPTPKLKASPWLDSSEESNYDEDVEEEEHEEEEELEYNISDHEFSPESDIEDDYNREEKKHARTAIKGEDKYQNTICKKCNKGDHPEWILLCDECDDGYHANTCIKPLLWVIPEGDWFCNICRHVKLINKMKEMYKNYDEMDVDIEELNKLRFDFIPRQREEHQQNTEDEVIKFHKNVIYSSSDDEDVIDEEDNYYKLRQRLDKKFNFKEYDEMIDDALGEDAPPNAISNEIEKKVEEVEEEEEEIIDEKLKIRKTKKRKLNDLNDRSDDDDDDDDDFEGSNEDDYGNNDEDSSWSEKSEEFSDDSITRNYKKRNQESINRRSKRQCRGRSHKIIYDDSDDEDECSNRNESNEDYSNGSSSETNSDKSWGHKHKKKANIKMSNFIVSKKKKISRVGDRSWNHSNNRNFKKEENIQTRTTRGKKINFKNILNSDDDSEDSDSNIRTKRRRIISNDSSDSNEPSSSKKLVAEITASKISEDNEDMRPVPAPPYPPIKKVKRVVDDKGGINLDGAKSGSIGVHRKEANEVLANEVILEKGVTDIIAKGITELQGKSITEVPERACIALQPTNLSPEINPATPSHDLKFVRLVHEISPSIPNVHKTGFLDLKPSVAFPDLKPPLHGPSEVIPPKDFEPSSSKLPSTCVPRPPIEVPRPPEVQPLRLTTLPRQPLDIPPRLLLEPPRIPIGPHRLPLEPPRHPLEPPRHPLEPPRVPLEPLRLPIESPRLELLRSEPPRIYQPIRYAPWLRSPPPYNPQQTGSKPHPMYIQPPPRPYPLPMPLRIPHPQQQQQFKQRMPQQDRFYNYIGQQMYSSSPPLSYDFRPDEEPREEEEESTNQQQQLKEEQQSEFGGLVSYFSSQRSNDDLDG